MPADTGPDTTSDPLDIVVAQLAAAGPLTAAALAERLGIAYSTITPKLRRLEADHRAQRVREPVTRRTLWHATPSPPPSGARHQTDTPSSDSPAMPASMPIRHPASGAMDRPRPRPASKPAVVKTTRITTPRTTAPGDTTTDAPSAADTPPPTATTAAAPGTGLRRPKGSIAQDVLGVLRARPDDVFKVAQLSATLGGTSGGAIANALHKLVLDGSVSQVCEKPASFQAA
jgi:hypothetical protein